MANSRVSVVTAAVRRAIVYVAGAVVVVATAIIATTLLLGVLVRYLFGGSLPWTSELPTILFPWLIMAGVVVAAARNQHLGVDYLARKLPSAGRRILELAAIALTVTLVLALAAQVPGILQFLQYQQTPVLGWPATYAFYSLPCGLVAVAVVALLRVPEIALTSNDRDGNEDEAR